MTRKPVNPKGLFLFLPVALLTICPAIVNWPAEGIFIATDHPGATGTKEGTNQSTTTALTLNRHGIDTGKLTSQKCLKGPGSSPRTRALEADYG